MKNPILSSFLILSLLVYIMHLHPSISKFFQAQLSSDDEGYLVTSTIQVHSIPRNRGHIGIRLASPMNHSLELSVLYTTYQDGAFVFSRSFTSSVGGDWLTILEYSHPDFNSITLSLSSYPFFANSTTIEYAITMESKTSILCKSLLRLLFSLIFFKFAKKSSNVHDILYAFSLITLLEPLSCLHLHRLEKVEEDISKICRMLYYTYASSYFLFILVQNPPRTLTSYLQLVTTGVYFSIALVVGSNLVYKTIQGTKFRIEPLFGIFIFYSLLFIFFVCICSVYFSSSPGLTLSVISIAIYLLAIWFCAIFSKWESSILLSLAIFNSIVLLTQKENIKPEANYTTGASTSLLEE